MFFTKRATFGQRSIMSRGQQRGQAKRGQLRGDKKGTTFRIYFVPFSVPWGQGDTPFYIRGPSPVPF